VEGQVRYLDLLMPRNVYLLGDWELIVSGH
jgi:hypothetical protein